MANVCCHCVAQLDYQRGVYCSRCMQEARDAVAKAKDAVSHSRAVHPAGATLALDLTTLLATYDEVFVLDLVRAFKGYQARRKVTEGA